MQTLPSVSSSATIRSAPDAEPEELAPDSAPYDDASDLIELVGEESPVSGRVATARLEGAPRIPALPPTPTPTPTPAPRAKRNVVVLSVLVALLGVNGGVVASLLQTRSEERRAHAPIAGMSSDLAQVKERQEATAAQLAEARAELTETRHDVAAQGKVLRATADAVDENAARQKIDERRLDELETRESRDVAALAARMHLAERRAADGSFAVNLNEAVKLIDAVQGEPPSEAARKSTKPAPAHRSPTAD